MAKFEGWKAKEVKPSFTDSVMFDQKTGLYLPVSKFDMGIDIAKSKDFSAVGYTNCTSTATLPPITPWSLGVAMMAMELANTGFYSRRLAELMYTASRVFEHNLAVRARWHKMRTL